MVVGKLKLFPVVAPRNCDEFQTESELNPWGPAILGQSFRTGPIVLLPIVRMREWSLNDPVLDTVYSRKVTWSSKGRYLY